MLTTSISSDWLGQDPQPTETGFSEDSSTLHLSGPARMKHAKFHGLLPVEPEEGIEQLRARISRLVVKVGKLEAKVRALSEEHTKLRLLLAEANAALAEAGVPYLQGNIRERINAYQVFHGLAKLYPKSPDRSV
jgi:hypothetical protein